MVPKNTFLFHAEKSNAPGLEGNIIIYINTINCWGKNKRLCGSYTDDEWDLLDNTLIELKLSELMESIFESSYNTVEEAKISMISHNFIESKEFSNTCKSGS